MRIAVVGAGISGLAAARQLSREQHQVTVFEGEPRAGGHAHTVSVTLDGISHPVDTGFLVLNERTYPNLLALFAELQIDLAPSDMSFSASIQPEGIEWSGSSIGSLFAQPANMVRPQFLRMVLDILRFNRAATQLASAGLDEPAGAQNARESLGRWLSRHHYGAGFRHWYLLPMAAAIWSCPTATMNDFPIGSFVRFFHNHGLLQVRNRPQWLTIPGGSQRYVERITAELDDLRLACPVLGISRARLASHGCVDVRTAAGCESFDAVVLATHSPQALAMLEDADSTEAQALAAIAYQPNRAWLHTDTSLMPRTRATWSAWNYAADAAQSGQGRVSVTYWLNRLQPLPFTTPVLVSLNPLREPDPATVIRTLDYEHPVFDDSAMRAQSLLREHQGSRFTWFAGAWMGYGFHEDGLVSGLAAAAGVSRAADAARLRQAA